MKVIINQNFCSGQIVHFGPENDATSKLWIGSKNGF